MIISRQFEYLRVVSEVVRHTEFIVEQSASLRKQPVGQRESVVVPGVVLSAERRDVALTASLSEVLVREVRVLDEATDVSPRRRGVR